MRPAAEISIELLDISGFGVFLDYLNDHLSDNGTGNTAYFQPLPRAEFDRDYRKLGLGSSLLAHAEKWAVELTTLEWIDLQMLSANEPAISLYRRAGYKTIGEVPEMFKIDGQAFSYTSMAKRIARSS